MGSVLSAIGRHSDAIVHCDRALAIAQDAGPKTCEAEALIGLARVHRRLRLADRARTAPASNKPFGCWTKTARAASYELIDRHRQIHRDRVGSCPPCRSPQRAKVFPNALVSPVVQATSAD